MAKINNQQGGSTKTKGPLDFTTLQNTRPIQTPMLDTGPARQDVLQTLAPIQSRPNSPFVSGMTFSTPMSQYVEPVNYGAALQQVEAGFRATDMEASRLANMKAQISRMRSDNLRVQQYLDKNYTISDKLINDPYASSKVNRMAQQFAGELINEQSFLGRASANYRDYQENIDRIRKDDSLSEARKRKAIAAATNRYELQGGMGQPDQFGTYNRYEAIDPSAPVDEVEIVNKIIKDWKSNQDLSLWADYTVDANGEGLIVTKNGKVVTNSLLEQELAPLIQQELRANKDLQEQYSQDAMMDFYARGGKFDTNVEKQYNNQIAQLDAAAKQLKESPDADKYKDQIKALEENSKQVAAARDQINAVVGSLQTGDPSELTKEQQEKLFRLEGNLAFENRVNQLTNFGTKKADFVKQDGNASVSAKFAQGLFGAGGIYDRTKSSETTLIVPTNSTMTTIETMEEAENQITSNLSRIKDLETLVSSTQNKAMKASYRKEIQDLSAHNDLLYSNNHDAVRNAYTQTMDVDFDTAIDKKYAKYQQNLKPGKTALTRDQFMEEFVNVLVAPDVNQEKIKELGGELQFDGLVGKIFDGFNKRGNYNWARRNRFETIVEEFNDKNNQRKTGNMAFVVPDDHKRTGAIREQAKTALMNSDVGQIQIKNEDGTNVEWDSAKYSEFKQQHLEEFENGKGVLTLNDVTNELAFEMEVAYKEGNTNQTKIVRMPLTGQTNSRNFGAALAVDEFESYMSDLNLQQKKQILGTAKGYLNINSPQWDKLSVGQQQAKIAEKMLNKNPIELVTMFTAPNGLRLEDDRIKQTLQVIIDSEINAAVVPYAKTLSKMRVSKSSNVDDARYTTIVPGLNGPKVKAKAVYDSNDNVKYIVDFNDPTINTRTFNGEFVKDPKNGKRTWNPSGTTMADKSLLSRKEVNAILYKYLADQQKTGK